MFLRPPLAAREGRTPWRVSRKCLFSSSMATSPFSLSRTLMTVPIFSPLALTVQLGCAGLEARGAGLIVLETFAGERELCFRALLDEALAGAFLAAGRLATVFLLTVPREELFRVLVADAFLLAFVRLALALRALEPALADALLVVVFLAAILSPLEIAFIFTCSGHAVEGRPAEDLPLAVFND